MRRLLPLLALPLLAVLASCASPGPQKPAKLALVIGNGAYSSVVALRNPTNDANDMCAALQRVGFKTLCHTNVKDRAEFDARVQEYTRELGPSTTGVFYYSGHGVQAGNDNFLIPTQVQLKSAAENPTKALYSVDELFDRLRVKRTGFQLVILDACRADLFEDGKQHGPGSRAPTTAAATGNTNLVRALKEVARASNGLQPIKDAPPGTIVLYATANKDVAFDGEGRNGPLTKHILTHINTRGIYVEEFIKRVTAGVEDETLRKFKKRQTPFIYGSFAGKFCFAGCPGENDVPVPPAF